MARIELSNIGGGVSTLSLTTTGTSGASTLVGSTLNIPIYQGALTLSTAGTSGASTLVGNTLTIPTYQGQISLTTTGTSGASTFVGNTLNIPTYQGAISLTTTGTSGAATLVGNTLNVPQYSTAPAGSTGQIQYNNAGAFGASANFVWDNAGGELFVGPASGTTGRLTTTGKSTTSASINSIFKNSSNTELMRINDAGSVGIGGLATSATLELNKGPNFNPAFFLRNTNSTVANFTGVGFNPNVTTNVIACWTPVGSGATEGGFSLNGFTGSATIPAAIIVGNVGTTTPTVSQPAVAIVGFRWNGTTGRTAMSGNEVVLVIDNGSAPIAQFRGNGNLNVGSSFTPDARLHVRGANTTAGVGALLVEDGAATPATIYRIDNDGKVTYRATNTAAGTTGAQTINRPSGTVNFAAGATALVVTNSLCTTASLVFAEVRTNDATAQIKNVVPAAGSFTINLSAAATAETSVGFFIIN